MNTLLQPAATSAERATPPCPHFGPCGGCQLQHLTYETQLDRKAAFVRELLALAVPNVPELHLHASPPLGYRNRIRLTLSKVDGQLRAGYLRGAGPAEPYEGGPDEPFGAAPNGKPTFLPITECPIAAPLLWRTAEAFLTLATQSAGAWLHDRHLPDQLELFTNADQSRLTFTLLLRTTSRTLPSQIVDAFTAFCEQLREQIPELAGAGLSLLPAASRNRSRRGEAPRPGASWGAPGINYAVPNSTDPAASLAYWVPRTAFFQVNRFLIPEMLALVTEQAAEAVAHAASPTLAFDLYAGAGLFTRPLARAFAQVAAVEIADAAFTALSQTKLANLTPTHASTLDFLRGAVLQRERPTFALLDPPRSGAGLEVCELLGRLAAPTLLYISCSPTHLAADLRTLTGSGYTLVGLHLFDLFPQTTHIETVAILRR